MLLQNRVDDSENISQTYRQQIQIALNVLTRLRIPLLPQGNDLRGLKFLMIEVFVKPCKPAAGGVVLNTAGLAAAAAGQRKITPDNVQGIHRQADMAELTGDIATPGDGLTVDHDPSADARAEDQSHDQWILTEFIIPGFRERKTVGIVI